jgi:hypothetical protein
MRGVALAVLLALAGCAAAEGVSATDASPELRGWRTAVGTPPSQAELAAVVAACRDRANSGPIEPCLADLGLRHAN